MKITILTPSFNQGQFIEKNIQSVLEQKHLDFEHIIIDGGSSDSTPEVLARYPHVRVIMERDLGQSHALNKGLRAATGDVVGWINSDDYYLHGAFEKVLSAFGREAAQWVVGTLNLVDEQEMSIATLLSPKITRSALLRDPDIVRQPCTFFRRAILQEVGGWDLRIYSAMDYDLWLKLTKLSEPIMIDEPLACFRIHSGQKSSARNLQIQTNEICTSMLREGVPLTPRILLRARKFREILRGYFKSLCPAKQTRRRNVTIL